MRLSPEELRGRLHAEGISRSTATIRNWCERGLPGAVKIGGTWEIAESTIELILAGEWDSHKAHKAQANA